MPARKLGRIQSRGRNRRAGWIDSNSLGILKGYFTSVRATEHKTSCCIGASSAITHWQSNPLGRKVASLVGQLISSFNCCQLGYSLIATASRHSVLLAQIAYNCPSPFGSTVRSLVETSTAYEKEY